MGPESARRQSRDAKERYYSPPAVLGPLVAALAAQGVGLRGSRVLEPCAGRGSLVAGLRAQGAVVVAVDVAPPPAVADNGAELWTAPPLRLDYLGDFLGPEVQGALRAPRQGDLFAPRPTTDRPFDLVVMNPPFSRAAPFVAAALELAPVVAALVRLSFLEGTAQRRPLLEQMGRQVHLVGRPRFARPDKAPAAWSNDTAPVLWALWGLPPAPPLWLPWGEGG
jgi:predicted RNA methylase